MYIGEPSQIVITKPRHASGTDEDNHMQQRSSDVHMHTRRNREMDKYVCIL